MIDIVILFIHLLVIICITLVILNYLFDNLDMAGHYKKCINKPCLCVIKEIDCVEVFIARPYYNEEGYRDPYVVSIIPGGSKSFHVSHLQPLFGNKKLRLIND